MTFQDPLDITMFVQRKVVNSALPFAQRHYFKKRWIKSLQMAARVWLGFIFDFTIVGILFGIYGEYLSNWNLVWKVTLGVCSCLDTILLVSLIVPLISRNSRCPSSLTSIDERLEQTFRCNLFILQFSFFKFLSFFHAVIIVALAFVIDTELLSKIEHIGRVIMCVIAGSDAILNAIELFSSGCFWCVCCIHGSEIEPNTERRSASRNRNKTRAGSRNRSRSTQDTVLSLGPGFSSAIQEPVELPTSPRWADDPISPRYGVSDLSEQCAEELDVEQCETQHDSERPASPGSLNPSSSVLHSEAAPPQKSEDPNGCTISDNYTSIHSSPEEITTHCTTYANGVCGQEGNISQMDNTPSPIDEDCARPRTPEDKLSQHIPSLKNTEKSSECLYFEYEC